jgi:hypothetical protein
MDELEEWEFWDEPDVKTHSEIVKMFKELEELEEKFRDLELTPHEVKPEIEGVKNKIEEASVDEEAADEPVKKKSYLIKKIKKQKKPRIPKLVKEYKIHGKQKIKKPKDLTIKKRDRKLLRGLKLRERTLNGVNLGELWVEQPKYTFVLKIDDEGSLVGFPKVEKDKKKKGKTHLFSRKKEKQESAEPEQQEQTKPKGIKGLFKRIIPKRGENKKGSTSFLSRIVKRKKTKESVK